MNKAITVLSLNSAGLKDFLKRKSTIKKLSNPIKLNKYNTKNQKNNQNRKKQKNNQNEQNNKNIKNNINKVSLNIILTSCTSFIIFAPNHKVGHYLCIAN